MCRDKIKNFSVNKLCRVYIAHTKKFGHNSDMFSFPPLQPLQGSCHKKKKKSKIFFSQVFLRPAHYTLGTLLRPKSQKKHELGCFEHLEFIPQPFSVPPVHFVWASALSKNRKISKKKKFFFGKISTTEVGLWAPKNAKKMQKSGVLTICGYTKHTSVYKPTPIQW